MGLNTNEIKTIVMNVLRSSIEVRKNWSFANRHSQNARGASHSRQNSSVCWGMSWHWWQVFITFLPIFYKYSPNTPCPASICIIRTDSGSRPRSLQASQFGRTDLTARWPQIWSSQSRSERHLSNTSCLASHRLSQSACRGGSPPEPRPLHFSSGKTEAGEGGPHFQIG